MRGVKPEKAPKTVNQPLAAASLIDVEPALNGFVGNHLVCAQTRPGDNHREGGMVVGGRNLNDSNKKAPVKGLGIGPTRCVCKTWISDRLCCPAHQQALQHPLLAIWRRPIRTLDYASQADTQQRSFVSFNEDLRTDRESPDSPAFATPNLEHPERIELSLHRLEGGRPTGGMDANS